MRYNTPNSPMDTMRDFVTRGGTPVTISLIAASVALFLASFFTNRLIDAFVDTHVAFHPFYALHAPWTIFTYPVVSGDFISLLIGCFFLWLAGGSLERSWGSIRYSVFFFALAAISALSLLMGSALSLLMGTYLFERSSLPSKMMAGLTGFQLPLSGMIVAFCMLNPNVTLMFYFFPVRAIYVAWIVTLLTYFTAGMGPLLNLFACGGIIAAFLYVKFGRPWAEIGSYSAPRRKFQGPDLRMDTRPSRPPSFRTTPDGSPLKRKPMDFAGRLKDWQERRRLEKLWKNSGLSNSEPDWRDDEKRRR